MPHNSIYNKIEDIEHICQEVLYGNDKDIRKNIEEIQRLTQQCLDAHKILEYNKRTQSNS
jgi:hypothetical protein